MTAYYRDSLLELELMHRQEELEQLELEQALAMSLMAEEEKIKMIRQEAKLSAQERDNESDSKSSGITSASPSKVCEVFRIRVT
jgi:hypothetical protein